MDTDTDTDTDTAVVGDATVAMGTATRILFVAFLIGLVVGTLLTVAHGVTSDTTPAALPQTVTVAFEVLS